jgi:hypothetical protein
MARAIDSVADSSSPPPNSLQDSDGRIFGELWARHVYSWKVADQYKLRCEAAICLPSMQVICRRFIDQRSALAGNSFECELECGARNGKRDGISNARLQRTMNMTGNNERNTWLVGSRPANF